jgi:hypothetical protein
MDGWMDDRRKVGGERAYVLVGWAMVIGRRRRRRRRRRV